MPAAGTVKVNRADGRDEYIPRSRLRIVKLNKHTWWAGGTQVPITDHIRGEELARAYTGMLRGQQSLAGLEAKVRKDGWLNALTGIGNPQFDKRAVQNSTLVLDQLSQMDAEVIWRVDDIAAKCVEKIPEEMTRQGWRLKIEDDGGREQAEATEKWARDLDLTGKAKEALEYARAYGGGGIFLGADDGQRDLTKPLDIDKIKTFNWLNVLTPMELFPRIWYGDPHAPKYGEPMIYRIQRFVFGGAVESGFSEKIFEMPLVHESRILRVDGIRVSRRHLRERNGWGDSIFMRLIQVISDFQQSYAGAAILASDFAQAVFKIKNLAELVAAQDDAVIAQRAQLIEQTRSLARAVIIDSEEEFERKSTSLGSLPELLERIEYRLAAAVDMPVSLLMGQSPAGMNATGESDIRWFYDRIKALQTRKLEPILRRLLQCGFRAKTGPTQGVEPKNWSIEFNPLWMLSDLEEAQRRYYIAQSDQIYVMTQVVAPEEVASSRFAGDQYNGGALIIDFDSRKQMLADPSSPSGSSATVPSGEKKTREPNENSPAGSGGLGFKENPPNPGSTSGEPS